MCICVCVYIYIEREREKERDNHYQRLQTVNTGESMEKKKPYYTVGRNVNWYSHYGEQYGGSLRN